MQPWPFTGIRTLPITLELVPPRDGISEESGVQKLFTVNEVAKVLGVPKLTLYKWRDKGYGPRVVRVGRYLRYNPSDLRSWIDAQT